VKLILMAMLAMLGSGAAFADDAPKRLLDQWTGIVFFCASDLGQPWTSDACAGITEDVVRLAGEAGMKVALLDLSGGPQWMEKSEEAGFDGGNALSMFFQFKASDRPGGNTALDLNVHAPADPRPGVNPTQWLLVFTQTTTINPGEHTEVAIDAAATVFSGLLEHLGKPAP